MKIAKLVRITSITMVYDTYARCSMVLEYLSTRLCHHGASGIEIPMFDAKRPWTPRNICSMVIKKYHRTSSNYRPKHTVQSFMWLTMMGTSFVCNGFVRSPWTLLIQKSNLLVKMFNTVPHSPNVPAWFSSPKPTHHQFWGLFLGVSPAPGWPTEQNLRAKNVLSLA